jgi:hypothetical protein
MIDDCRLAPLWVLTIMLEIVHHLLTQGLSASIQLEVVVAGESVQRVCGGSAAEEGKA